MRETQSAVLGIIGGGVGLVGGLVLGFKLADEITEKLKKEKEQKEKERAYMKSVVSTVCNYCNSEFKFSTYEFTKKDYCDSCISKIRREYNNAVTEIETLYGQIKNLQRKNAILSRLDKGKLILEGILKYEDVNLPFISAKPSELLNRLDEYYKKYS